MAAPSISAALAAGEPNLLGETLRAAIFPRSGGDELGCYTTFATRPDARPMPLDERVALLAISQATEAELAGLVPFEREPDPADLAEAEHASGVEFSTEGLVVEALWRWDGDGWLFARVLRDGELAGAVVNDDCKKTAGWRWVAPALALAGHTPRTPVGPRPCAGCGVDLAGQPGSLALSVGPADRSRPDVCSLICAACGERLAHMATYLTPGITGAGS